jgi:hypothetical protein
MRVGFRLPGRERRVPRWAVVGDPHHLRQLIPKALSDCQLRLRVASWDCLLGSGRLTHLHTAVSAMLLPPRLSEREGT